MKTASPGIQIESIARNALRLRLIAFCLVVLQSLALGMMSRSWIFSILAMVAAACAVLSQRTTPLDRTPALRLVGLGLLIFLTRYLVAPPQFPRGVLAVRTELAHVISEFLVAFQIAILYLTPRHIRLPAKLPWLGVFSMVCAADVIVEGGQRWNFQTLAVFFTLLLVAWTGMSRPFVVQPHTKQNGRTVWIGVCMVVTAILTWGSATLLYRYENDLDLLISKLIQQPDSARETGFSGDGRLESVTRMHSTNENSVALRIVSESTPDYLRGSAFIVFSSPGWLAPREHPRRLTPVTPPDGFSVDPTRGNIFAVRGTSSALLPALRRMECWPNPAGDGGIFSTVDSEFVQFNVDQTSVNKADIVDESMLPIGFPYQLFRGRVTEARPLNPHDVNELTMDVTPDNPRIDELAGRLFGKCVTDQQRIAVVKQYFDSYLYSESTIVPPGRHPIEWFLLDQPGGHCEFFASAAVALLRKAGIPSRYVTGYVVTEQNLYGNYWVARNRDAHAWAEAWIPERGWIVVEATPGVGIPQPNAPSTGRQLLEFLQSGLQSFRVQLNVGGIRWLTWKVITLLLNPFTLLFIGLTVTLLWLRSRRHSKQTRTDERSPDPQLIRLNRLLAKMDRRVASAEFRRLPHETLHQFAERIESVAHPTGNSATTGKQQTRTIPTIECANWYREYALLRYGQSPDAELIRQLEAAM